MILVETRAMNALEEIATLRAALADREAELATARAELTGAHLLLAQYKAQLHKLRRMQFGRSSEALDEQIHQLELKLEDPRRERGRAQRVKTPSKRGPARPRSFGAGTAPARAPSAA